MALEWYSFLIAGMVLLGISALFYWEIHIVEGVHLGRRWVAWLYDRFADRYDEVKEYDWGDEELRVGAPLMRILSGVDQPRVLDVATGTGRAPRVLLQSGFTGQIIGVDSSLGMLRTAIQHLDGRATLICKDAESLPFDDEQFHAVSCLEALEFMPDPGRAVREMVRVTRTGGVLVLSNRVGWESYLFLTRRFSREQFETLLRAQGLDPVLTQPWQMDYDLIWACKSGRGAGRPVEAAGAPVLPLCPACATQRWSIPYWRCQRCGHVIPQTDGILLWPEANFKWMGKS